MIKRVDFIKNFGVFNDFNWSSNNSIDDFNEKNIFYGWNYSGKTTISRIFSSLRDKAVHPDFVNGEFKVSTFDGTFGIPELTIFPYHVEVFNSDYIRENLRWGFDEHINAIYFEVGDNAKLSSQIDKLNTQIDSINGTDTIKGKKEKYDIALNNFREFEEGLFTQEASKIKNDAFSSLIEFNKGHLKKIRDKIIHDLDKYIIKSQVELRKVAKVIKDKEPQAKLDTVIFESRYDDILNATIKALGSEPAKSDVIDMLDKNNEAYSWAKQGLDIHSKDDNCIFCGNLVTETRFKVLTKYFQNQASKLREEISDIFKLISIEEASIEAINIPLSVNDFNTGHQEAYEKQKIQLTNEIAKYKKLLNRIKASLTKKIELNIYSSITVPFLVTGIDKLKERIQEINDVINSNNGFVDNFDKIIENEREKYKSHLVAKFLKKSKYLTKKDQHDKAAIEIEKLNIKVDAFRQDIERLNALKKSDTEGCAQFNSFVQSFLSREDIEVKFNEENKKFNLMRGSDLARNLSEGEKMAISFSHFLVHLKSLEQIDRLKNCVVFIDDPISSLDSNHVFQINSLLKETFFDKVPNPSNSNELIWSVKCKQLFVSTHNFEFFNLLKELPTKTFKRDSRYYISRLINESTIEKLPNVYNRFSSEYHYLFDEIMRFNRSHNKGASPRLLTIPNILRRFVEMYTLTKYPSADGVDERANEVFGKLKSKRIMKLMHHFSHFDNIDRMHKHSESIADIENACKDLIDHLKKEDPKHYEALKSALI